MECSYLDANVQTTSLNFVVSDISFCLLVFTAAAVAVRVVIASKVKVEILTKYRQKLGWLRMHQRGKGHCPLGED